VSELRQARFGKLFGSPLLEHFWADGAELNAQLRQGILEHSLRHPGDERTNLGGWHSEVGGLEFCGSAGKQLIHYMHLMTEEATHRLYKEFGRPPERNEWVLSAWANVNRKNDSNTTHTHPGATWSGIYYVDSGNSAQGQNDTSIQLFDPNPARTNIFFPELHSTSMQFAPVPGLMIIFPSYVPHAVPPHQGNGTRISIAFNVRRDPFP
jgi:uncharacterized protein (TIGR02466 family)